MPKTDYFANAMLNRSLRGSSPVFVGLFTTPPIDDGTGGVEVMGGGYTRAGVTFEAPIRKSTKNEVAVVFPIASAPWGSVSHFGVFDSAVGGNLMYFDALAKSRTVPQGDQVSFKPGQLVLVEI